jgi:hypothetical protein
MVRFLKIAIPSLSLGWEINPDKYANLLASKLN